VTQMTCKEFEEVVHDFVRMEMLDVNEREAVLEHTARCAHCSERLAAAIAVAEMSQMAGESVREEQAPPRVEAVLLAAFREDQRRAFWRHTFEWVGVGAAAAVLLAFLWTTIGGSKQQQTPVQKKDTVSQPGVPLDARISPVQRPNTVAEGGSTLSSAVSERSESYAASDFVPVPFAAAVTADDPGMIVRVQLTRASLAQLGYPVAEAPDEELISADVLVGEDGWPRGVKLIH
jgi:hypothetical protein